VGCPRAAPRHPPCSGPDTRHVPALSAGVLSEAACERPRRNLPISCGAVVSACQ